MLAVPRASVAGASLITPVLRGVTAAAARAVGTYSGWEMEWSWPRRAFPAENVLCMDVIVNERPANRERRRGQLVLSGGGGFAYLAGDRHAPSCGILVRLSDMDPLS